MSKKVICDFPAAKYEVHYIWGTQLEVSAALTRLTSVAVLPYEMQCTHNLPRFYHFMYKWKTIHRSYHIKQLVFTYIQPILNEDHCHPYHFSFSHSLSSVIRNKGQMSRTVQVQDHSITNKIKCSHPYFKSRPIPSRQCPFSTFINKEEKAWDKCQFLSFLLQFSQSWDPPVQVMWLYLSIDYRFSGIGDNQSSLLSRDPMTNVLAPYLSSYFHH